MKIATMAIGGIGGYLAVRFATAGHQVAIIARGAHLKAIRANGLKLKGFDGDHVITPWITTDTPEEVGPVDAIIFGVKGDALHSAGRACALMLGPETIIILFLNGVEASDTLAEILPEHNVGNGIAQVSTTISQQGVTKQIGEFNRFSFAERDSRPSARIDALRAATNDAGVVCTGDRRYRAEFILFSAGSGITSAARCTISDILNNEHLTALYRSAVREAIALAYAKQIAIPDTVEEDVWKMVQAFPPTMRASTAIDLENGRSMEIDWITGAVVRLSEEAGLEAPVNKTLYALLSLYTDGNKT